jgi:DNA-binding CsgD family transcriptional regulator
MMDSSADIVGRDAEQASVNRFLEEPGKGFTAILIEGDVGIGKTTIWQDALRLARERVRRVLVCRPAENEPRMAYSGLIDLLGPVVAEVTADLPPPQRKALNVALLREPSDAPVEGGAVAIAVTGALRNLAGDGPLVLAIDDLQWLDAPTQRVLAFALRRQEETPVRMVATQRIGSATEDWFEAVSTVRLPLPPLSLGATYQLVHTKLGVALPRPSLVRVHETSGGNPFFALELARGLMERGDKTTLGHLPVPQKLGDLVRRRLDRLDAHTRRMLLLAAALGTSSIHDLQAVAGSDIESHLSLAEKADILDSAHGVIRFTHPLLAAAIYDGASGAERRAIHSDLARKARDPEAHAAHLALSASGPDEDIAAALEAGAQSASNRGATDVAASLAEHAAELTPASGSASRRAIEAGTYAMVAGDRSRARSLFEQGLSQTPPGPDKAEALMCLARVSQPLSGGLALCDQALREASASPELSSRIHRIRGAIAYFLGDVPTAERDARLAVQLAEQSGDASALGMALAEWGHWIFCGGGGIRRDLFERAIALDASAEAQSPRSHLAKVLMDGDALEEARARLLELLDEAMRNGMVHSSTTHHVHLGELELWSGNWELAIQHAEESLQLGEHIDRPSAPIYVKAMAQACRGDIEEANRLAEFGLEEAQRSEDVVYAMQNLHVLGFVQLSLGKHEQALGNLGRATQLLRPRWNKEFGDCHVVPDEIEAALGYGDLDRAEDLTSWMENTSRPGRPWTRATAARSRALVQSARKDPSGALLAIEEALVTHQLLPMPFELARTHLVHGVILRRMKRRAEAREALGRARALCEGLGAALWTARVEEEMARLGVRHVAQTRLTPIEERIAALVAEGRRNREIATSLSVSPKTVEANLTRIYRKLGIRSRAQLAVRTVDPRIRQAGT